ncbi:MAG: ACP S-malonyltransferase [Christensenella sp.]
MKNIGFVFSGQGAQCPGMMKELYDKYPAVQNVFKVADETLGRSISELCFNGTQEELNLTHNTQPCMLAADLAAFAAISSEGIKPNCVAGFSLGEYAALIVAGVIEMADAFRLVQFRADAMQLAVPVGVGGMVSLLGVDEEKVKLLCNEIDNGYIDVANYNCPGQIVLSGEKAAIQRAIELAKEKGIMAIELAVSAPFHCKLMAPAADALKAEFAKTSRKDAEIPIYLNVDGNKAQNADEICEKVILQAKSAVQWQKTLLSMQHDGVNTVIELGPGKTLSGLAKRTVKDLNILRVENEKTLTETLAKLV